MNWTEINLKTDKEIKALQEEALKAHLNYLSNNSPYYSKLFKSNQIKISSIKSLDDLVHLPVTEKKDLQLYNQEFICVEEDKIIDYVTTSGTLGEPVTFVLTDNDLERLSYNEYISLVTAGVTRKDKVQLTVTMDRTFMAGLAYFSGLRKIGAGIIRVGPGIPELQWNTILKFKPTVLIAVPSFVLHLIQYAQRNHIDLKATSITKIICIGDSIRDQEFHLNQVALKIKEQWPVQLISTYASTEMATAFTECEHGMGGHIIPQLIIVECLDEFNRPVKEEESGELVVTPLGVEGMPLLRFKTGDITTVHKSKCVCGRTSWRVGSILGRKNHMIKYKGTTLYPSSLSDVLNVIEEVDAYYIEVFSNEFGLDELVAKIHTQTPNMDVAKKIKDAFRTRLRVTPELQFVTKDEVDKVRFGGGSRKPLYFLDRRGIV